MMKVFIAFPFSQIIDPDTRKIDCRHFNFLNNLRETLINRNYDVFLAHYREKWGKELMSPQECTYDDFQQMKDSDLVLAFPGSPISGGVHIELGWASTLNKEILLFLHKDIEYSPLITGLFTITTGKKEYIDDNFFDDGVAHVLSYVEEFKKLPMTER